MTNNFIKDKANKFYKLAENNHRFLSWEHCYSFFYNNRENLKNEKIIDLAALNLAFYLASWGMYRGSSFLLQYDYKIFIPIIKGLFEKNDFNDLFKNPSWDKIEEAKKIMTKIDPFKESTETLITKILMGIFGCVPAFDRFFKEGYKIFHGGKNISFNETGFEKLQKIEQEVSPEFKTQETKITYPKMKIIDMAFWQYGFDHYFKGYTLTDNKITLYRKKPRNAANYKAFDKEFDANEAKKVETRILEGNLKISLATQKENFSDDELQEILGHLIERSKKKQKTSAKAD